MKAKTKLTTKKQHITTLVLNADEILSLHEMVNAYPSADGLDLNKVKLRSTIREHANVDLHKLKDTEFEGVYYK